MATTLHIEWRPNPDSEGVTTYKVWESVNGGPFLLKATTTKTFHEILNPGPNRYYYTVSAHNSAGDSPNSESSGGSESGPIIPTKPSAPVVTLLRS